MALDGQEAQTREHIDERAERTASHAQRQRDGDREQAGEPEPHRALDGGRKVEQQRRERNADDDRSDADVDRREVEHHDRGHGRVDRHVAADEQRDLHRLAERARGSQPVDCHPRELRGRHAREANRRVRLGVRLYKRPDRERVAHRPDQIDRGDHGEPRAGAEDRVAHPVPAELVDDDHEPDDARDEREDVERSCGRMPVGRHPQA